MLCLRSYAFLIVDSTFHGQCHVEAGKGRGQYCFSKPSLLFSPFEHGTLQQKAAAQELDTSVGQLVTRCHLLNWSQMEIL